MLIAALLTITSAFSIQAPLSQLSIHEHEPDFKLSVGSTVYGYRSLFQQEIQTSAVGRADIGPLTGDLGFIGAVGVQPKGTSGFFDVTEGAIGLKPKNSSFSLLFGRHQVGFSELDRDWNTGIWEPRNRWDYLNPIQVGLIGAFLKFQTPLVTTEFFASPLFLPESNPPSTLVDGAFVSNNPWFKPPSNSINLRQQSIPMRYEMAPFSAAELISKFGASAKIRVGREHSGPYLQLSGGYKPMNQLLIGYDGVVNIANDSSNVFNAKLKPSVGYQRLVGVDGGIKAWNGISQKFSVLSETALMPPINDSFSYQQAADAISYSTTTVWTWNESDRSNLTLGYLRRLGGNAGDVGSLAALATGPGQSIFEDRYTFSSAVKLGVETGFGFVGLRKLSVQSDLTYDFLGQMEVYKLKLSLRPRENLSLMVGLDLLGSQLPAEEYSQNWIRSFSYNDRVYGGVSYVF